MHVEAEDEEGASGHLHLLDDLFVSFGVEDFLILPERERVGARGDDCEPVSIGEGRGNSAKICEIGTGFLYILADSCAHLDHRLNHLRPNLLAQKFDAIF